MGEMLLDDDTDIFGERESLKTAVELLNTVNDGLDVSVLVGLLLKETLLVVEELILLDFDCIGVFDKAGVLLTVVESVGVFDKAGVLLTVVDSVGVFDVNELIDCEPDTLCKAVIVLESDGLLLDDNDIIAVTEVDRETLDEPEELIVTDTEPESV
jgi:hypothetical protein